MNEQLELNDRIKTYEATKKPDAATVIGKRGSTALGGTLGGI